MNQPKKVIIIYFTDILCIWAYLAQIKIDMLKKNFGSDIILHEHFISIFGSVKSKIEQNWGTKGGAPSFCDHAHEIASKFSHIELHPDIWVRNQPTTSMSCHLFLKAIQILESRNELPLTCKSDHLGKSVFETVTWELRLAFFRDLIDISNYNAQMEIAEKLGLPIQKIQKVIESGAAFPALEEDLHLKVKYGIIGSPTFVLNEGRQIIYGNVGYRVIEANIKELLNKPENQASWC